MECNLYNFAKEYDLIWENSDSTEDFAAKTLSLDLSNYEWVLIGFKLTTSSRSAQIKESHIDATNVIRQQINLYSPAFTSEGSTAAPYVYSRLLDIKKTGITFTTGYRHLTNATTAGVSSASYVIPVFIMAK